jgi:hypothetical protein
MSELDELNYKHDALQRRRNDLLEELCDIANAIGEIYRPNVMVRGGLLEIDLEPKNKRSGLRF